MICSGLYVVCPIKRLMWWGFSFQLVVIFGSLDSDGESRSPRVGSWPCLVSDTLLLMFPVCLELRDSFTTDSFHYDVLPRFMDPSDPLKP